jgi:hypothetical protein
VINSFSPQGSTSLPIVLQRMHGHLPGYPHPFRLNAGEEVYVDVIDWRPTDNQFTLRYNDNQNPNPLAAAGYEIGVVASALNIPAVSLALVAELDANNLLTLVEKP